MSQNKKLLNFLTSFRLNNLIDFFVVSNISFKKLLSLKPVEVYNLKIPLNLKENLVNAVAEFKDAQNLKSKEREENEDREENEEREEREEVIEDSEDAEDAEEELNEEIFNAKKAKLSTVSLKSKGGLKQMRKIEKVLNTQNAYEVYFNNTYKSYSPLKPWPIQYKLPIFEDWIKDILIGNSQGSATGLSRIPLSNNTMKHIAYAFIAQFRNHFEFSIPPCCLHIALNKLVETYPHSRQLSSNFSLWGYEIIEKKIQHYFSEANRKIKKQERIKCGSKVEKNNQSTPSDREFYSIKRHAINGGTQETSGENNGLQAITFFQEQVENNSNITVPNETSVVQAQSSPLPLSTTPSITIANTASTDETQSHPLVAALNASPLSVRNALTPIEAQSSPPVTGVTTPAITLIDAQSSQLSSDIGNTYSDIEYEKGYRKYLLKRRNRNDQRSDTNDAMSNSDDSDNPSETYDKTEASNQESSNSSDESTEVTSNSQLKRKKRTTRTSPKNQVVVAKKARGRPRKINKTVQNTSRDSSGSSSSASLTSPYKLKKFLEENSWLKTDFNMVDVGFFLRENGYASCTAEKIFGLLQTRLRSNRKNKSKYTMLKGTITMFKENLLSFYGKCKTNLNESPEWKKLEESRLVVLSIIHLAKLLKCKHFFWNPLHNDNEDCKFTGIKLNLPLNQLEQPRAKGNLSFEVIYDNEVIKASNMAEAATLIISYYHVFAIDLPEDKMELYIFLERYMLKWRLRDLSNTTTAIKLASLMKLT